MKNLRLSVLSKEVLVHNIKQLIEIDCQTSELLGIKYGKPWGEKEFLFEVQDKWKYSVCALEEDKVVGFIIISKYGMNIHSHRLAMNVFFDSSKKIHITKKLYEKLEEIARKNNIMSLTAIVPIDNLSTVRFYLKEGWIQLDNKKIDKFILQRHMNAYSLEPNLMIDKISIPDEPDKSYVLKYNYER
tara:strand:+ start:746 stop:1306 length:561 start_codon:yes stop_codon:yes gene_type:complete